MTPADLARANAIQCEMVLYAYRKNKDGVVVSFVVHPNDMPAELATAPIGARFVSALVQVGDDELPITPAEKEIKPHKARTAPTPRPDTTTPPKSAGAKRDWRDVQPAAQAGIRCDEPTFVAFLQELYPDDWHESQDAAACVRLICGVASRSDLSINHKARVIWHQLDERFQAWKMVAA